MRLKKIAKALAVLIGLFLLFGFNPAVAREREKYVEKFEETVKLARDGEVKLRNLSGSIEVKTWDKDEVKIDALKVSLANSLREAEDNAKEVKIVIEEQGSRLRIRTEYPEQKSIWKKKSLNVSVNYILTIPDKASVDIDSTMGSVDLEKMGGAVTVNVTSGDIEVRGAAKGVDCEAVSGDLIVVDVVGDSYLKATSGEIAIDRVRGSIRAEAISGAIEMRNVSEAKLVQGKVLSGSIVYEGKINPEGRYELETQSGKVEMRLPADSSFEFEAKTFSGKVESDFEIRISGSISARQVSGVVNKGGAVVKLSVFSGNISLKKI